MKEQFVINKTLVVWLVSEFNFGHHLTAVKQKITRAIEIISKLRHFTLVCRKQLLWISIILLFMPLNLWIIDMEIHISKLP